MAAAGVPHGAPGTESGVQADSSVAPAPWPGWGCELRHPSLPAAPGTGWVIAMARIAYDSDDAAAFEATRHIPDQGLTAWRRYSSSLTTSTPTGWLDSATPPELSPDQ